MPAREMGGNVAVEVEEGKEQGKGKERKFEPLLYQQTTDKPYHIEEHKVYDEVAFHANETEKKYLWREVYFGIPHESVRGLEFLGDVIGDLSRGDEFLEHNIVFVLFCPVTRLVGNISKIEYVTPMIEAEQKKQGEKDEIGLLCLRLVIEY